MIKTDWKAKLKTTLAVKEKNEEGSKTPLTKGDKTQINVVSSVFVSAEPSRTAEKNENVFDVENKTGTAVIQRICALAVAHEKKDQPFINFDQPTRDAYESEIALVEDIRLREARQISHERLEQTFDRFIEAHSPEADLNASNWIREWIMLFYVRFLLNGKEIAAYTVNPIQLQIVTAFWLYLNSETKVSAQKL
jgi:hypothetical protein